MAAPTYDLAKQLKFSHTPPAVLRISRYAWVGAALISLSGIFFLASASAKLCNVPRFLEALQDYQLIPSEFMTVAGAVFISVEFTAGLAMLIPRTRRFGVLAAIGLLVLFSAAVIVSLLNGLDIKCGCSLPLVGESKISWSIVGRNILIAFFLAVLLLISVEKLSLHSMRLLIDAHFSVVLTALMVLLMGSTILKLKQSNNFLLARLEPPAALKAGDPVPPFRATRLGGGAENIAYSESKKTVLLVFSTHCPHCEAIIPSWNKRFKAESEGIRYIGISVSSKEEVETFVKTHEVAFPVYLSANWPDFAKQFKVFAVPQAIEIGPDGKVMANN